MIQEAATYIILLITTVIALRNVIKFFNGQTSKCSSCAMSVSGCKIAEMKKKRHSTVL